MPDQPTVINGNLKYRIEQLEKHQERNGEKLDRIMTNHLPHIELAIVELKTRINILTAINIGALLLTLVIQRFFL